MTQPMISSTELLLVGPAILSHSEGILECILSGMLSIFSP